MAAEVKIGDVVVGTGAPLVLIAGPDVIESRPLALEVARRLGEITAELGMPLIYKASFDKANRTSVDSFRGPGLEQGLTVLREIKETFGLPVLTDIHLPEQAEPAAEVVDVIQVPAFLCRQTDLVRAAARTGRAVNIKKGQFVAPADVRHIAAKCEAEGNRRILLTERGYMFGYNNLVVDMRSIPIMSNLGYPVVFDATHSVQLPSASGGKSGGEREFIPHLARAAVAAGADAVFMEVHPRPDSALCDAATAWPLDDLAPLLQSLIDIHNAVRHGSGPSDAGS